MFNLNNENMDQNLKKTGHQLIALIAGTGAYKVNAEMVNPTKSRALLGGTSIQIVSLALKPPFQTPVMIRCCTYKNPFEINQIIDSKEIKTKDTKFVRQVNKQGSTFHLATHNLVSENSDAAHSPPQLSRRNDNDDLASLQSGAMLSPNMQIQVEEEIPEDD